MNTMHPTPRYLDVIWIILLLGTGLTWWLGESDQAGSHAMLAMLTIAGIKGVLVIREFMALRGVRLLPGSAK